MVTKMGEVPNKCKNAIMAIFKKKPEELYKELQAAQSSFGPWESHRERPLQEEKHYSLLRETT